MYAKGEARKAFVRYILIKPTFVAERWFAFTKANYAKRIFIFMSNYYFNEGKRLNNKKNPLLLDFSRVPPNMGIYYVLITRIRRVKNDF